MSTHSDPAAPLMTGRRSNIGPLGMASLAIALAAAIVSLCGLGGIASLAGGTSMVVGFACFFLNREAGSKRDLLIGIGSMLLGFLVLATSVMFDNSGLLGLRPQPPVEEKEVEAFPETNTEYRRTTPDPFSKPALPEPTRPATRNQADEDR